MLSHFLPRNGPLILVLTALALVFPASAFAWNNFPSPYDPGDNYYNRGYYYEQGFYGPGYAYQGFYYPGYYSPMVVFYPAAPTTRYQAAYPSEPEEKVNLTIHVPKGAEIWFNGHKTKQSGTVRQFVSPPLNPGNYIYDVRVVMKQKGQSVAQSRRMMVHPGDQIELNFQAP